jgi:hypothetical protein
VVRHVECVQSAVHFGEPSVRGLMPAPGALHIVHDLDSRPNIAEFAAAFCSLSEATDLASNLQRASDYRALDGGSCWYAHVASRQAGVRCAEFVLGSSLSLTSGVSGMLRAAQPTGSALLSVRYMRI